MKTILCFSATLLLCGCMAGKMSSVRSLVGHENAIDLSHTQDLLKSLDSESLKVINNPAGQKGVTQPIQPTLGTKVGLYGELINLFDPDNFACGCDAKLKVALRKIKRGNQNEKGFIPEIVLKNGFIADSVLLLERSGSNLLAHIFQYRRPSGNLSKPLFAKNAVTAQNFNEADFMENRPSTFDNFLYTLDCSGFLSAAVAATAGFGGNSMKSSAEAASISNKSLFMIGGVMYSPLYQSFKGEGMFAGSDSMTLVRRINTLQSILKEIPYNESYNDTEILLNSDYRMLFTSNAGTSSFNGEAAIGFQGGVGFALGSITAHGAASGTIERRSEFSRYNTYIIDTNVNSIPPHITVGLLEEIIANLQAKLEN